MKSEIFKLKILLNNINASSNIPDTKVETQLSTNAGFLNPVPLNTKSYKRSLSNIESTSSIPLGSVAQNISALNLESLDPKKLVSFIPMKALKEQISEVKNKVFNDALN